MKHNKKWKRTASLLAAVCIGLSGCNSAALQNHEEKPSIATQVYNSLLTEEQIIDLMPDEEKNWMGLTTQEYLEDFDYLYQAMVDNYPYFGVVERKLGIVIEDEYQKTRQLLEDCTNSYDFWCTVRDYIGQLDYTGHISAWGTRYAYQLESLYEFIEEYPQYEAQFTPYIGALENIASKKNYQAMEDFFTAIERRVAPYEDEDEENTYEDESSAVQDYPPIVTTEILAEDHIAYVNIRAFDMMSYETDKTILMDFYNEVADYDHLIIDITNNGGGGMGYFSDLVVAPNIDESLTVNVYSLIKGGDIIQTFLLDTGLDHWKNIEDLPALPNINQEDLKHFAYFSDEPYVIKPSQPEKIFKGDIWLLVSEYNYSSSEYAAMFSKHSGFATLVGNQTGGDGIGVDPVYIVLPHSGLVVQFSPVYGISHDGTGSEEFGTEPDFYQNDGETALEACLRIIAERR